MIVIPIKQILLEKEIPSEEKETTQPSTKNPKSFIKNTKEALKHPKYQKLLATNGLASAVGGLVGTVGGAALLKTIKPLTEDQTYSEYKNPPPEPPQNSNFVKDKFMQDLRFIKGISNGVYRIGKGSIVYPYKAAKKVVSITPDSIGSAVRLGVIGAAGKYGYDHIQH